MMTYGGDKTMVLSAAGHIQSMVNPPAAATKRQYFLNPNKPSDPDEWLKGATAFKGSWWSHWLEWEQRRSGQQIAAPPQLGSAAYPPLAKSPGTYVLEK